MLELQLWHFSPIIDPILLFSVYMSTDYGDLEYGEYCSNICE